MEKIIKDNLIRLDSPRVWRTYTGGSRLDLLHGSKKGIVSQFPEEWIMSVVATRNAGCPENPEEGMSHLPDYRNLTLRELIESDPSYYLGKKHAVRYGSQLGVLVKLIDAAERLTVQVHPNRQKAKLLFQSEYGKTECWHILEDAPENGIKPCVYMGFKPGITRKKWKNLFECQDITEMLDAMHRIEVKKGDTILIQGGIPHAIGEGCFLMEIQEPTDYTIRIERVTPAGLAIDDAMCHQGLGFEKMFECFSYKGIMREQAVKQWFVKPLLQEEQPGGRVTTLIGYGETTLFRLDKLDVWGDFKMAGSSAFSGIYVIDGKGSAVCGENNIQMEKGDQFFIPADIGDWRVEAEKRLTLMHFMGPKME